VVAEDTDVAFSSSSPVVGVYGKVAAQADFVRINVGELTRLGMDRWFQDAHEVVHSERSRLPDEPAFFVLAPSGARAVLLGAMVPGQDAVGRSFPVIVFAVLDAAAATDFPLLPQAYGQFFEAAAALLQGAAHMTAADLGAQVQSLNGLLQPERTADVVSLLRREHAAPLGLALGGLPHGAAYAFRTLITGCDRARSAAHAQSGVVTVDGPSPTETARLLWLELIRRRLGWRDAIPSFMWTARESARLLVSLGPPASGILAFLANPRHKSGRFWPLRTDVDSALDQAVASLAPEQRRVLESPATLADLLAAFG
jgi:type VI secretion system ImpM family protein